MEGAGDTVTAPALLHPGVLALSGLHTLGYAPTPTAGSTESPGLCCGPFWLVNFYDCVWLTAGFLLCLWTGWGGHGLSPRRAFRTHLLPLTL